MRNPFNRAAPLFEVFPSTEPFDEFFDLDPITGALQVSPSIDQTVSARDLNITNQMKLGANLKLMTSYFSSDKTIDVSNLPSADEFKEEKPS